jgi:hypothetical protein
VANAEAARLAKGLAAAKFAATHKHTEVRLRQSVCQWIVFLTPPDEPSSVCRQVHY